MSTSDAVKQEMEEILHQCMPTLSNGLDKILEVNGRKNGYVMTFYGVNPKNPDEKNNPDEPEDEYVARIIKTLKNKKKTAEDRVEELEAELKHTNTELQNALRNARNLLRENNYLNSQLDMCRDE